MPFDSKKSLRDHCLSLRQGVAAQEAKHAADLVAQLLAGVIGKAPKVIAGYAAVRGEMDVMPALGALAGLGHTLCLPVVVAADAPLEFRRWAYGGVLEKGAYGIAIPPAAEPAVNPNIVIVPLIAFDAAGHRLGYGAGYYDRTIAGLRKAQKSVEIIGVAYSQQQVDRIPSEAHDQKLDAVVTEKNVVYF